MKPIAKLTSITLVLLLSGGAAVLPITAHAKNVIVVEKPTKQRHQGKVIVIEKPPRRHAVHNHRRRGLVVAPRTRYFRGARIVRPHGRSYFGYGFFSTDSEAYKWLAFTAITLKIMDNFNEEQQRMHEEAQVRATTASVNETIVWEDGNATGSVKTTRIGTSTSGRQCREFQQTITIGGKSEQAYGTACQQPDGAWEIVQ